MRYLFSMLFLAVCALAVADPQIPNKLVGVWTTDGSVLRGDDLVSGKALYIDVDGVGSLVSRTGGSASRSRVVVTAYNANAEHIDIDVTVGGETRHITLNYEPDEGAITTPEDDTVIYRRRRENFSSDTRKKLGLEEGAHTIPSITP